MFPPRSFTRECVLTITSWLILEDGVEPFQDWIEAFAASSNFFGCGKFPLRHAARCSSLDTECEVALFTACSDIRLGKLPREKDKGEMVPASPKKFEQTYYCQAGIAELRQV